MSKRTLIFGALGQVGLALQQTAPSSTAVIAHDLDDTDIRSREAVARALADANPDLVINCAAYTNVDAAETHAEDAQELNGVAPGIIAEVAMQRGARLIHLSTDYVFDGKGHLPYTPDSHAAPANVYGATKLAGERRVLASAPESVVVRTAWVHSSGGSNFIRTVVQHLIAGKAMRVVDDQVGTPTRARHLAEALWCIASRPNLRGVLHFTDAGVASWFDVAVVVQEVLKDAGRLGVTTTVAPTSTTEFPRPAARPPFSVLDKHESWNAIGYVAPHWRVGVIASTLEVLRLMDGAL